MTEACHCDSGKPFAECCQPLHDGVAAPSAEALMRSRYSAYVRGNSEYLLYSWHPDTRPRQLTLDDRQKWLGLKIKGTEDGEPRHTEGTVEFVARYKIDGKGHRLHECSRFTRYEGRWVYLDAV